jgi:hypothetical protein
LKNALTTAKKLGIAVDDIFRNSRPDVVFTKHNSAVWMTVSFDNDKEE